MYERTTRRSRPDSRPPSAGGIGGTGPTEPTGDAGSDTDGDAIDSDGTNP
ncbi:hypothetical protein [Halalkalicoccus ordinarius]